MLLRVTVADKTPAVVKAFAAIDDVILVSAWNDWVDLLVVTAEGEAVCLISNIAGPVAHNIGSSAATKAGIFAQVITSAKSHDSLKFYRSSHNIQF